MPFFLWRRDFFFTDGVRSFWKNSEKVYDSGSSPGEKVYDALAKKSMIFYDFWRFYEEKVEKSAKTQKFFGEKSTTRPKKIMFFRKKIELFPLGVVTFFFFGDGVTIGFRNSGKVYDSGSSPGEKVYDALAKKSTILCDF